MNDYEVHIIRENHQRSVEYTRLIHFLVAKSSLKKWDISCSQYNQLSHYVYSIVENDWYTYRPYKLLLERLNNIKQWPFSDIRSLPDSIYMKINYIDSNLSNDNPRITDRKVNIFNSIFVGSLRTAIIQYYFDNKVTLSLNKAESDLRKMKDGIYASLITILGIFVAIIVAVFGGFQSFGNLFENANKLGFGKSISLSAIALFGLYLILILLFYGISRLTHHNNYRFSIKFNIHLISSFVIIFFGGIFCSRSYIFSLGMSHWPFRLIALIIIVILIVINYFIWKHPYNKILHRYCKK